MTTATHALARLILAGLLLGGWWDAPSPVNAAPINLSILSGTGWLTSTNPGAGLAWTSVGFDDSSWVSATAPYPNSVTQPTDIVPGTAAQLMWNCSTGCNPLNGSNGPNEAFFRYEFNLALAADSLPLSGQALVSADDYFEMYVNGTFVRSATLDGHQDPITNQPLPIFIDFTNLLQGGANVIALRACDGFRAESQSCFNRGNEDLFFDGKVQTVAEPASLLLLATGLITALVRRRRNR